jgi:hypothetical protein
VSLRLYFDHHVPRAIAVGVQQRGIDVLTTEADRTPIVTTSSSCNVRPTLVA